MSVTVCILLLFHCMWWNMQLEQMATAYSRRDVEHKEKAVYIDLLKDVGEMYTVNLPPL